jgi:hypothetical protein
VGDELVYETVIRIATGLCGVLSGYAFIMTHNLLHDLPCASGLNEVQVENVEVAIYVEQLKSNRNLQNTWEGSTSISDPPIQSHSPSTSRRPLSPRSPRNYLSSSRCSSNASRR